MPLPPPHYLLKIGPWIHEKMYQESLLMLSSDSPSWSNHSQTHNCIQCDCLITYSQANTVQLVCFAIHTTVHRTCKWVVYNVSHYLYIKGNKYLLVYIVSRTLPSQLWRENKYLQKICSDIFSFHHNFHDNQGKKFPQCRLVTM